MSLIDRVILSKAKTPEGAADIIRALLRDPEARADLLSLLSFSPSEGEQYGRAAQSWLLRTWWSIMHKDEIGQFMAEVLERHNRYWKRRDEP